MFNLCICVCRKYIIIYSSSPFRISAANCWPIATEKMEENRKQQEATHKHPVVQLAIEICVCVLFWSLAHQVKQFKFYDR